MHNNISTEIVPLTAQDKKIMHRFIWLMFKIFCGILAAVFLLMCTAADWQTKAIIQIIFPVWVGIALMILAGFFVWFIVINKQFKNPYKMIISGKVVDTFVWKGKYPEFNVFLGDKREEFKLLRGYDFPHSGIEIGNKIAMHFILKKDDKLGSLIKTVKL